MRCYTFQDLSKHPSDFSRSACFSVLLSENIESADSLSRELLNLKKSFDCPSFNFIYKKSESVFELSQAHISELGLAFSIHSSPVLSDSPDFSHASLSNIAPEVYGLRFLTNVDFFDKNSVYNNVFFIRVLKSIVLSKRKHPASHPKSNDSDPTGAFTEQKARSEALRKMNLSQLIELLDTPEKAEEGLVKSFTDHTENASNIAYSEADDVFFAQFMKAFEGVFARTFGVVSRLESSVVGSQKPNIPIYAGFEATISIGFRNIMISLELMQILISSIYQGEKLTSELNECADGQWNRRVWRTIVANIISSEEFFKVNFPFLLKEGTELIDSEHEVLTVKGDRPIMKFLAFNHIPADLRLVLLEAGRSYTFLLHKELVYQSPFFLGVSSWDFGWGAPNLSLECIGFTALSVIIAIQYMYYNALPKLNMKRTLDVFVVADFLGMKNLEEACTKKIFGLMHGFSCNKKCCQINVCLVFNLAMEFKLQELMDACCGLVYKYKSEFWTSLGFSKLHESIFSKLLDKATSSIGSHNAIKGLVSYHLLNEKLDSRAMPAYQRAMDLSKSIFDKHLQMILGSFAFYLKNDDVELLQLLSGTKWSQDLVDVVLNSLIKNLNFKDCLDVWIQMHDLIARQSHGVTKEISFGFSSPKDDLDGYFLRIGMFIKRNQLGILIDGGFSRISSHELELIKKELNLNLDLLEYKPRSKKGIAPAIKKASTAKTAQFQSMSSSLSKAAKPNRINTKAKVPSRKIMQGTRVKLSSPMRLGVVRYIGPLHFVPGTWFGIELDDGVGKSDGFVQGVRYFQTEEKHALFVKEDKLLVE